ncbi:sterile alpha motif domain-containing protein 3 isoform X4 [Astyanax mexicanus]|uniref:Sterile alpha motif domain-containing protein 3-like n=2 Tax=Astyanax mexicanus TaxID=7994 RepID=A0A3B1INR4_ASTMX|nr:sterile alpha motif domain-containing protein 3-like isoform X2 [Astyanax mexicanus]XP_049322567.1 sterile alpha motif domain-containing protein 3 isoform X4 [Astyanax mexicanus]XP_049341208.1 sterile alpha motif domain-containing protein 3 isoform X4 [Astyanax mexicanus]
MAERLIPIIKKQAVFMSLLEKLKTSEAHRPLMVDVQRRDSRARDSSHIAFPPLLLAALERRDHELKSSRKSKTRTLLLQALFDHLSSKTLYPTHHQYVELLSSLITVYPYLKENFGSGYDALHESLKNKFKKERRPLVSDEEVARMRRKFSITGSGRKRTSEVVQIPLNAVRTPVNGPTATEEVCVEERNITEIVKTMAEEVKKIRPDMMFLQEQMTKTREYRRTYILSHPTREILMEFPCLRLPEILLLEMKALQHIDVDKQVTLVLNKMAPMILLRASHSTIIKRCLETIEDCQEGAVKKGLQLETAILCLPSLFSEDASLLFAFEESGTSQVVTPQIILSGCKEGVPLQHSLVKVTMDKEIIVEDCTDISLALCVLFSTYFVFGVEYPKGLKKTLTFLEAFVFKMKEEKFLPITLKRVFNSLCE